MKDMVCKVSNNDTPRSVIDGCMRKQLLTNIDSLTIALNSAIGTLCSFDGEIERCYDCMDYFLFHGTVIKSDIVP